MIKNYRKYFCTFTFVCCINILFAQQYDSLFNANSLVKMLNYDLNNPQNINDYINDTSAWRSAVIVGIGDLKHNNEIIIKTTYWGNEYENPSLVLLGLSSGFELYRDSLLIYAAGKHFNSQNPGNYFDTHIIPLEKPLTGSVFVMRIHFESYLDITGFSSALFGETNEVAQFAKMEMRQLQKHELPDFVFGIILFIAGILSLTAFLLRLRLKDWLLFWFFVFAASQGYVFVVKYLMMLINISPAFLITSTVIVENLVPIGIIGIIAAICGFTKNIFVRIMILLHVAYTALHLLLIHFDFYNMFFWLLVIADIILFVYVFFKSKIFKNPDFRLPVIALSCLMVLVVLDIFAIFGVFFIAKDLSSYGMLFVAISFAWYIERSLFRSRQKNLNYQIEIAEVNNKLLVIENKNVIAQYEALKNQVNPHFLFNSLNILSSLIRHEDKSALRFIEEFADIYRYVLDVNDKTLIETHKEISFVNSYSYLQKLRYGAHIDVCFVDTDCFENTMVVPLSVQILVENAIKHNEISEPFPLKIEIFLENDYLIVRNKIKKLNYKPVSKQIGLRNLSARYAIITDNQVFFEQENDLFTAKIPLIKMEDYNNESIYY